MRKAWGPVFAFLLAGVVVAACDPDLNIVKRPGTKGSADAGPKDVAPSSPGEAAAASDLDAGDDDDGGSAAEEGSPSGPTGHKIDGIDDFGPGEKLPTTSSGNYDAYIAWDATRLYFGMSGPDVGSKASNKWVHVYLGVPGTAGTKKGIDYGGQQQPTFTFEATHHLRWKASGDFTTVEVVEAGSWKAANPALVPIVAAQQGNFMEMSVVRASINAIGKIAVHMNMLIEGGDADWTYAGVPSTSFTDSKNPSFGKYFEFDLTDTTKAPSSYVPQ